MRSYIIRTRGLGSFFGDLFTKVATTAENISDTVNTFVEENPDLAQIIKEGGTAAITDLRNKGVITQDMYNALIAKPPIPPPAAESGMSTGLMVALGIGAVGAIYFLTKED